MANPPRGGKSISQLLSPVKNLASKIRRSLSPRPQAQPSTGTRRWSPVSTLTAVSMQSGNLAPQDNSYLAIGGPLAVVVDPETRVQQAKVAGSVIYEGLKIVVQGLYKCSDIFLPLKTVAGGILTFIELVETVLENKKELEDLKAKLEAILSIVGKYKEYGGLGAINHRIENFCQAITFQFEMVEKLQKPSQLTRAALAAKHADTILKALRNISSLCDIFQIDTQLNIEVTVGEILEHLDSGFIDKLNHEMTSYKTRQSSYGDPIGCMPETRVKVLEDLEAWALNDDNSKVYWMIGMAGTGKSTISHTLCEILEAKNMLGGNFFCSRASDKTSNARLIIPVIAHALARASPSVALKVVKAIKKDPYLAEVSYHNVDEQFKQLIYNPLRTTTGKMATTYKVVIIDAVDECVNLEVVSSFIKLVLKSAPDIPLKIFITSRDEYQIRKAFNSSDSAREYFYLHDIEKDVVQKDIRKYLETSMARIKDDDSEEWPSAIELSGLVQHSGTLFIYAATAFRYIANGGELYKSRLSEMATQGLESVTEFNTDIDFLYIRILEKACEAKQSHEVAPMRDLVSIIIFLRNPLPMDAIASLSERNAHLYLLPLTSVIHIPKQPEAVVAPFHASFRDFITNSDRCSPNRCPSFHSLVASESHKLLALKCLRQMNRSLKYNICEIPKELTLARRERTNSPGNVGKISEALKYSCLYWASHLAEVRAFDAVLVDALHTFLHEHLLHWMECLSTLGELQTGLKSLRSMVTVLSTFKHHDFQLLVDDARRCLQMNFEAVQKHSMEIYQSTLVWIPKKSMIRETYVAEVSRVPKVILGLSDLWGQTELVMQNGSRVQSVAFSQDGSRVMSGSEDNMVRIWNVTTGGVKAELKGHTASVVSVAFSQDGSRVVSGSVDRMGRIWNATTGEVEAELKGHTASVMSVAFSQDGRRVVSGSWDKMVRIWNATTGGVSAELQGHTDAVTSAAFSQDGSRIVSGSWDKTVRIWNATTGGVEAELKGHTASVTSVAFSQDGSRVVFGSCDNTVRIWNPTTGGVAELKGHTDWVSSVVFSQDGSRVISGSKDKTVRIWNAMMGRVEAELKGHTDVVCCVGFSQDGSQIVSGSTDETVRIWNATTGGVDTELEGHTDEVTSVAFSQDGSRFVSGSWDKMARIWNVTTGRVEAELKGHTAPVMSVAFSQDGSKVASGSRDNTALIWNATTGVVETELEGHTDSVTSVAFSQDGSQVVSGSWDKTVRIWNVMTGKVEAELKGLTKWCDVCPVAFSQDGSQVVSGSWDKTIRIWNVTTENLQLMTTSDIILADGGKVKRTGLLEDFQIIYQQPTLSIADDGQWIVGMLYDCQIPPHYRKFTSFSIWGSRICLGYPSGYVVVLDITVAP